MSVRYTETAFAELAEIISYIAADNPRAASAFIARLEQLLENLREFPRMTRFSDEEGAHVAPVGRYPYLLFYAVEGETS